MAHRHGFPGIGEAPRKPVHNRPIILLPGIVPLEPPEPQHRFIRVFQRTPEDMAPDMLAPSLAAGVGAHFLRDGHRVIPRMCVPQSLSHLLQPANHGRIAFHHGHAGRTDHPGDARSFTGMTQQIGLFIGNQPAGLIDGDKLQFLDGLRDTDLCLQMGEGRQMDQRREFLCARLGGCRHRVTVVPMQIAPCRSSRRAHRPGGPRSCPPP